MKIFSEKKVKKLKMIGKKEMKLLVKFNLKV